MFSGLLHFPVLLPIAGGDDSEDLELDGLLLHVELIEHFLEFRNLAAPDFYGDHIVGKARVVDKDPGGLQQSLGLDVFEGIRLDNGVRVF